jgi:uncharacterized protein (DUF2336 family)
MAQAQDSLIAELERATHSGSPAICGQALTRVTDLFLASADRFSEEQVLVFEEVFEFLIQRIETRARQELSTRLALVENAPMRIVQRLARDDEIIVAEPILTDSPRLTDYDLIEIASTKGQGHLLAISGRGQLGEGVTDVLLDRGNRDVIHKLARNVGARFSEPGFTTLVVKAEGDDGLAEMVGLRLDVPNHLFQKLLSQATRAVRSKLLSVAPPETQREIRRVLSTVSKEIAWQTSAPCDFTHAQELVSAMHGQHALNEAAIASFAKMHKYEEMVAAFSLLCSVPLDVIDSLMCSPRHDAVLIPCRVANLSWSAVRTILDNRFVRQAPSQHDRDKLGADYARLSQATAQRLLGFWQARAAASRNGDAHTLDVIT